MVNEQLKLSAITKNMVSWSSTGLTLLGWVIRKWNIEHIFVEYFIYLNQNSPEEPYLDLIKRNLNRLVKYFRDSLLL